MKQEPDDYYREAEQKTKRLAQEEEMCRRADHLRAFNLGRTVQRIEESWYEVWLRVGWLLAGLAIGVACGRVYPDYVYPALAHKFLTQASLFVRGATRTGLSGFWRSPRP